MANIHNSPYANLGSALRAIRLRGNESLLEASAAIEITGERLALIENGELRPSEDILELLITHYEVSEREAEKIWDLAGYKKQDESQQQVLQVQAFMLGITPQHIMYSDSVQVSINDYGVTINFMQQSYPQGQQAPVSRIGMSKAHAKSMVDLLQKVLNDTKDTSPKRLDPPQQNV